MASSDQEIRRLEAIAGDSWYAKGANGASVSYLGGLWARSWRGGSCLELGPAEGLMTAILADHFDELTLVDGSQLFCDALADAYPSATVVCSLFENFDVEGSFDAIVLGHVLEHVEDPIGLVKRVTEWLAPNGRVFACVPNARSIHRQAAVIMGLLADEHELNSTDRHHGHRRVLDPESFRAMFVGAGLNIEVFGGYWLKPLSNSQIDEQWTPEMLDAFMALGERYPDIAAEIYVIAKLYR